jgi:TPR repeat protein
MYKHIILTLIFFLFAGLLVAQDANQRLRKYDEQMDDQLVETLRRVQENTEMPEDTKKLQIKASALTIQKLSEERQKQILSKLPQGIRKQVEKEIADAAIAQLNGMKQMAQNGGAEFAFRLAMLYIPAEYLKPTAQRIQKTTGLQPDPKEAYKYFKLAYDKGKNFGVYDGLFGLGICYAEGFGVQKDAEKAKEIFKEASKNVLSEVKFYLNYNPNETPEQREAAKQKAAEAARGESLKSKAQAGDSEAEREYGVYLISKKKADVLDEGGTGDAAKYLQRAAKKGDKEAQFQLAKLAIKHNWGMISLVKDVSRETAIQYLTASPEKLDGETLYNVGKLFDVGKGGKKDVTEAVKWFIQAADKGFTEAQWELATRYRIGTGGCPKDEKKSGEYYQKCAAGADENAPNIQLCKAFCLQYGYGTEKNLEEAEKLLRKSAEQGFAGGQTALGVFLLEAGEMKNRQEAVEWFKKAVEKNDAAAMIQLANCYQRGFGVAPNDQQAFNWYEKAAKTNDAEAQYQFAVWYDDNKKSDKKRAFSWFSKAAEQGHVLAQVNLGLCYLLGKGADKNKSEAEKWLKLAAEQGNETAAKALKVLDKF